MQWCQQYLKNLQAIDIGEEIHFIQEDNPHLIGSELAKWYLSLNHVYLSSKYLNYDFL